MCTWTGCSNTDNLCNPTINNSQKNQMVFNLCKMFINKRSASHTNHNVNGFSKRNFQQNEKILLKLMKNIERNIRELKWVAHTSQHFSICLWQQARYQILQASSKNFGRLFYAQIRKEPALKINMHISSFLFDQLHQMFNDSFLFSAM